MSFTDKTLDCRDCGNQFTFTEKEQEFYAEKGFENEPARCPSCRAAKKELTRNNRRSFGAKREMHQTTCSECGVSTEVPFKPSGDRPIYCRECFQKK